MPSLARNSVMSLLKAISAVVVPMFMLLGISPEMTTAAYRMGDSYTNIMTPLMSYFPLILAFGQRWDRGIGVGSLLALMLPYALSFMVVGIGTVSLFTGMIAAGLLRDNRRFRDRGAAFPLRPG